jgi:Flp pilus assembly protein TadG
MIEFAVILPLFLLLLGGVVDFGIYMFQREQASSCVRTVARKASVRSETAKSIAEAPQCQKASSKSALTLTPDYPAYKTWGAGKNVTASINYQYTPIFLGMVIPGGISMPVSATMTMRMEAGA